MSARKERTVWSITARHIYRIEVDKGRHSETGDNDNPRLSLSIFGVLLDYNFSLIDKYLKKFEDSLREKEIKVKIIEDCKLIANFN